MEFFLFALCIVLGTMLIALFVHYKKIKNRTDFLSKSNRKLTVDLTDREEKIGNYFRQVFELKKELELSVKQIEQLSPYQKIIDVEQYLEEEKMKFNEHMSAEKLNWEKEQKAELWIFNTAKKNWEQEKNRSLESLNVYKRMIVSEANTLKLNIRKKIKETEDFLNDYSKKANHEADQEARQLLGEFYDLAVQKLELANIVKALENKIEGYSDEYLLPVQTLLDDLVDGYDHLDAAQKLKQIKLEIKMAIKQGVVAECDYVEETRKTTAIAFITNAFNGKADVHVSRLRYDNVGKLIQALKDDYLLLNNYGQAFRGTRINPSYLALRIEELKWGALILDYREKEREEQREIREQIKEEERARKEYERAIKETEKEEQLLKRAYEKAKREFEQATDDQKSIYDQKMHDLMAKLKEAEERNERALSMAQQTRAGHVYVISNIGAFGDNILKLGMTRRLEPMDRIRELGDASVPFTFDVHAMIYSEDAPTLEKMLHHRFNHQRVNKVNYRKEFFKVSISDVKDYLKKEGIEAKFTMKAEALQYRETQKINMMPDEERKELEHIKEQHEEEIKDCILLDEDE